MSTRSSRGVSTRQRCTFGDAEAATPGVNDALSEDIVMTSFFSPITDTGIPTARSDEASVSFEMGAQMAKAWKDAHPDKPIVMVQLGWPNHTEVNSGRTAPFVEGVLSIDPNAENLGALDSSQGQEAAKQIIVDLLTQRPEVNLIYSEASNLTVGTMAGLSQLGRGKFDNGKPVTEIVASVDFDAVEFDQVYDPNSSLKVSMGLPPVENRTRSHRPDHGCCWWQDCRHFGHRAGVLLQGLHDLVLEHGQSRRQNLAGQPVRRLTRARQMRQAPPRLPPTKCICQAADKRQDNRVHDGDVTDHGDIRKDGPTGSACGRSDKGLPRRSRGGQCQLRGRAGVRSLPGWRKRRREINTCEDV